MPKIETKTFNADKKPIERHIKKFCIACGKWYDGDKCSCKRSKR